MELETEMDAAAVAAITATQLHYRKTTSHQSLVESSPSSSSSSSRGAPLEPITPDSNRETLDYHLDSTPPLPSNHICSSIKDSSPCTCTCTCTPSKDVLFDPFAPGPHKLMLAPYCTKYDLESRISVARQLTFPSCSKFSSKTDTSMHDKIDDVPEEEMMLFEAVYLSILEAIISTQTAQANAKVSDLAPDCDGFRTPTSAPHLSGVADTCPRAPVKLTYKFRSIDKEICRKLEF